MIKFNLLIKKADTLGFLVYCIGCSEKDYIVKKFQVLHYRVLSSHAARV